MRNTISFIAGPLRADTHAEHRQNIERARAVAEELWRHGYPCFCPHLNTAYMSGIVDEQVFLDGALLMLRRCDNVVLVGDWVRSAGARREVAQALERQRPIYATPLHLFNQAPIALGAIGFAIGWAPRNCVKT